MVTVTFTGDPEEVTLQARQFFGVPVEKLTINQVAQLAKDDSKGLAEKIKEEKTAKGEKAKTVEPPTEKAPEQKAAPTGDLFAAIQIVVPRVGKEKGRQGAVDLLAKYGAKNGKEIKPADQSAFLAEANALLPEAMRVSA